MKKFVFILLVLLVACGANESPVVPSEVSDVSRMPEVSERNLSMPVEEFDSRRTKKVFGQYISPDNSPVEDERFRGFHTGVDIEFPEKRVIPAYAISDGEIFFKRWVSGYGGVVVLKFKMPADSNPYLALYGHVDLDSINQSVGDPVKRGEKLGELGESFSNETDGERKHLHFGIMKEENFTLRGYVSREEDLWMFLNPVEFLKRRS